ncbi:hypothetical protein U9M48_016401 [Paspalum notatum var. saurae]|uniref:Uncharacterized protein n=1 Tax=Paspalum notatum var. saurae TaxID=547442 RepID=A0AAQ3WMT2_PASNO
MEQLAQLGAVAAGAYAVHEKHQAKKDPAHAHSHKVKEEIAAAFALGSAGFAFHEHHTTRRKQPRSTTAAATTADTRCRRNQDVANSFSLMDWTPKMYATAYIPGLYQHKDI